VEQVSRPVLIALVAVIGFAGVWFAVLRPKTESASPSAPAVPVATPAASKPAVTPATKATTKPAAKTTKPATKTSKATADRSAPILSELAHKKVVVMLFWTPKGADDRAARGAIRGIDRHHGKVVTHVASIENVGDYEAITRNVDVLQSPTVVVIGPDHKARTIVGYTDHVEINQTVSDVLR
jgi:hypothetical protein